MSDKPISDLTEVTDPAGTDVLAVVNAGETKKVTINNLLQSQDVRLFIEPDSLNHVAGTTTSVLTDVQTEFDGNVYSVQELAAAPGFDFRFGFTGIENLLALYVRFYYVGGTTHGARVQLYNYNTTNWDTLYTEFGNNIDYRCLMLFIANDANYVDGSGNALMRFYHSELGNASHDVYVDYVAIVEYI